jgi:glycosyltransferase involved in cell wall biosynthesis
VIKTLIISFNYPPTIGGIETYAKELHNYFKNVNGINFLFPSNKKSSNPILRGLGLIYFIFVSLLKSKSVNYKLVHLTSFNLWFFAYLYSYFNKKCIFLINIWGLEFVYKNKEGLLPKIYNKIFLNNKILNSSNFYYLVSSEASKNLLLENGFDRKRIKFIKLGVPKSSIKSSINLEKPDENYFLFVGRIVKRKGLSWFVKNVLPNFPSHRLKVVGPIADKQEFQDSKHRQVDYLGVVTDSELKTLRENSSVCIVPNIFLENDDDFEAFCFVTIESVASGSIVVASNYQGIPEALLNGKLGSLPNPSNVAEWNTSMHEVINLNLSERQNIIEQRSFLLENELSWDKLFKETQYLYSELSSVQ